MPTDLSQAGSWGFCVRSNVLFWPLVTLVLATVALYLAEPSVGALAGTQETAAGTVWLVVFAAGLPVAAAGRALVRGGTRTLRHVGLWLWVLAAAAVLHANRAELVPLYDRLHGNIYPSVALTTAHGEASLRRAWDGHYRAEAEVNGVRTRLMVDTGASMVLLPYEEARSFGIDPAALEFSLPVMTANGTAAVAPVRIASIRVGPVAVFDVEAAVAQPGMLKIGLLGMSFLDELSETSFRGGTLFLRN